MNLYSFDFAQMVQYTNNPDQTGAKFFKTPRICHLFGICNEVIKRQHTYVINEAADCGKVANTVNSYLHHFFGNHGFGESYCYLQADNYSGQNKNNTMIRYLCWRVYKKLHDKISLGFMLAGHTKFVPDRCFGIIKKSYRSRFVSSLYDIAKSIEESSEIGTNLAQIIGHPDGTIVVPVFD